MIKGAEVTEVAYKYGYQQFKGVNQAIVELVQSVTEQQRNEMHQVDDLYPHQVLNVWAIFPNLSFTKHEGTYANVYSEIWLSVKEKGRDKHGNEV